MMVSPPSLAIIARYSWLQLKRLVGMTSPNTTPFANFYTDSNRTDLKLYCDRLSYYEKEDLSKLQVGEIEFRTDKMLSGHEYVKLSVSYQGSVVGYAVMEIGLGITRRSRSEHRTTDCRIWSDVSTMQVKHAVSCGIRETLDQVSAWPYHLFYQSDGWHKRCLVCSTHPS